MKCLDENFAKEVNKVVTIDVFLFECQFYLP